MPAKLTIGKLAAHDRYMERQARDMGSPAMASRKMRRRVNSAMERETDSTHKTHDYPKKPKELAMSILRNEPAAFDLAKKKLKQTKKELQKTKETQKSNTETKTEEGESGQLRNNSSMSLKRAECLDTFQTEGDIEDEKQIKKGKPLSCSLLGGKKKKGKRKTKRRRKTRRRKTRRRKTRRRTKRRVKKHRKRKTRKRKK